MKIIVLGGGSDQITLMERLRPRCSEIVLIDYYDNPVAKPFATRHYKVSTLDIHAVHNVAEKEMPDMIVTACIDQALLTAAIVSEHLGLPFYLSEDKAREVTNKILMKRRFNQLEIPSPRHAHLTDFSDFGNVDFSLPVVVKPADSNGSLGVTRADDLNSVKEAFIAGRNISRSRSVVVEEYVEGEELSIDVFVHKGIAHVLLITSSEKRAVSRGFPILRSRYPADLEENEKSRIADIIQRIADGFHLTIGPMIVQMIRGFNGLRVLEFGARTAGGSKHHLIKRITGFDVMEAFVKMLFREDFNVAVASHVGAAATTYVYCNPGIFSTVVGVQRLIQEGTIDSVNYYKTPGMEIAGAMASRDRPLSYISVSPTTPALEAQLRRAEREVRVLDPSGIDLVIRQS
jgi:carbamoylphosphate synthase large subunit